jgi:hypothetical protein
MSITIQRIRNIAADIIADVEWVNDSQTISEHAGIVSGLEQLIRHIEGIEQIEE